MTRKLAIFFLALAAPCLLGAAPALAEDFIGWDLVGGDYRSFETSNSPSAYSECVQACASDPHCMAATLVRAGAASPNPVCRLKEAGFTAQQNPNMDSWGKPLYYSAVTNEDRTGSDYRSFELVAPHDTILNCREYCQNDPACMAFTYLDPGMHAAGAYCYLKNAAAAPSPMAGAHSGLIYERVNSLVGSGGAVVGGGSTAGGGAVAGGGATVGGAAPPPVAGGGAASGGGGAVAGGGGGGTIPSPVVGGGGGGAAAGGGGAAAGGGGGAVVPPPVLSGGGGGGAAASGGGGAVVPPPVLSGGGAAASSGAVSLDYSPWMEGVALPGNDILTILLPEPNPALCRDGCDRDMRCVAWSYFFSGAANELAQCFYKDGYPTPQADSNTISGVTVPPN